MKKEKIIKYYKGNFNYPLTFKYLFFTQINNEIKYNFNLKNIKK